VVQIYCVLWLLLVASHIEYIEQILSRTTHFLYIYFMNPFPTNELAEYCLTVYQNQKEKERCLRSYLYKESVVSHKSSGIRGPN